MKIKCNDLFYLGIRKFNIIHAQLRMKCSKLNADLFALHVIDSPACTCGHDLEDTSHFLLHCPLYIRSRHKMFTKLYNFINADDVNMKTLLFGTESYDYELNCKISKCVHTFISESGRF